MRLMLVAASLVLLAACGEGSTFDNSFKQSFRTKGIESCVSGAQAGARAAGVDFQAVCECMIDRTMEGKSARDLMSPPDEAEQQRIASRCVAEIQGSAKPTR